MGAKEKVPLSSYGIDLRFQLPVHVFNLEEVTVIDLFQWQPSVIGIVYCSFIAVNKTAVNNSDLAD